MAHGWTAAAAAACLLLSGCQIERDSKISTRYSDIWTSDSDSSSQADSASVDAAAFHAAAPDNDPNYIATGSSAGGREYLLADSIRNENGVISALVEYRYAAPQKLPERNAVYTHNRWFEQIDCAAKVRILRNTTHYDAQGNIVDANEYPVPDYTAEQIKLLAQPDDGVIREVCRRAGAESGGNTPSEPAPNPPAATTGQPETVAAPPAVKQPETAAPLATVSAPPSEAEPKQPETAAPRAEQPPAAVTQFITVAPPAVKQPETAAPQSEQPPAPTKQTAPLIVFVPPPQPAPKQPETAAPRSNRPDVPPSWRTELPVIAPPSSQSQPKPFQNPELPPDFWTIGKENLPQ